MGLATLDPGADLRTDPLPQALGPRPCAPGRDSARRFRPAGREPPHLLRPVRAGLDPGADMEEALADLLPGAGELLLREPAGSADLPPALRRVDVSAVLPQAALEGL